jgi:YVTN family beta-propeller protein
LQDRIAAELQTGRDLQLIAELSILAEEHPFVERFHGQLMLALYRTGRQAEALAVHRRLRGTLVDELGIEPGSSVRELEQAILRQEPLEPTRPLRADAGESHAEERPRQGVERRGRVPGRRRIAVAALGCVAVAGLIGLAVRGPRDDADATSALTTGNAVAVLDASHGDVVGKAALPASPAGVVRGAGAIWVSQLDDRSVLRLDPVSRHIVQTIPVGRGPNAMAFGGGDLWVANSLDGSVSRIDPKVNRVVDTFEVGAGPSSLAFGGGSLWVADARSDELVRVDGLSGQVL